MVIEQHKILPTKLDDYLSAKAGKVFVVYGVHHQSMTGTEQSLFDEFAKKVPEEAEVVVDLQTSICTGKEIAKTKGDVVIYSRYSTYISGTALIPQEKYESMLERIAKESENK